MLRLTQLGGAEVVPADAHLSAQPLPVVLHIVGAVPYLVLGAFQFAPRLRRGSWHRRAGRLLVPAGLLAGSSALWMLVYYPHNPVDWPLPGVVQLAAAAAWIGFLVLGFRAGRRRDFAVHSRWMTRGYAMGQGAGTQALLLLPLTVATGNSGEGLVYDVLFISAWAINLAVAEWVIRRRSVRAG